MLKSARIPTFVRAARNTEPEIVLLKHTRQIGADYTTIIIGGMPRSGTHLVNALACTVEGANPLLPEASYLFHLAKGGFEGVFGFYDRDGKTLAETKDAMATYHASVLQSCLDDLWIFLDRPKKLVIKYPRFVPMFELFAAHLKQKKLVYVSRNPYALAASRKKVAERSGRAFNRDALVSVLKSIVEYNRMSLASGATIVRYEAVCDGDFSSIEEFMDGSVDPTNLWKSPYWYLSEDDPWHTVKFGGPIVADKESWRKSLTPDEISLIRANLGKLTLPDPQAQASPSCQ